MDSKTWINENYQDILQWAKNASQGKSDYEDLAHYAITIFLEHTKADELVERGEARWFIVRILLNSSRGVKSEYYRLYRPKHDSLPDHTLDTPDTPYNFAIDTIVEHISGVLEDLKHGDAEEWFNATCFELCMRQEKLNFSKLARETGIPRTSIANAYYTTIEYVKLKLKDYGFNIDHHDGIDSTGFSDFWSNNATH